MSDQNDKLPNAWHAEYLKASDRAISMERERDQLCAEVADLRAENSHLRMENGLAEFHKLNDQNAELLSRFSKLAELLGFPIGGEYCALEKAIWELMREKAEAIGDLAVCEEHAQTMERDLLAQIESTRLECHGEVSKQSLLMLEIDALRNQLDRICKEGFNNDDTISCEPADDYVLRQIGKLKFDNRLVRGLLQSLRDETLYPPQPNCTCFTSPPCSDCTRHGPMRELLDQIDALMKGDVA